MSGRQRREREWGRKEELWITMMGSGDEVLELVEEEGSSAWKVL